MAETSPIFKPPKTRRLVSAWMVREHTDHAFERVSEFQDIFDQVILMCGRLGADGSLPPEWSAQSRRELVARFGDLGVSVLNDFGGTWDNTFAEMSKSPKAIEAAVGNMIADCEETGADGVDIDLEHLPSHARFAYQDLLAQLSDGLHARSKMLSVCTYSPIPAYQRDWGPAFWDPSVIGSYADHLRPMTYDQFCPPSPIVGPTSTAPWGRECMETLVAQVPRHKIVMGLPTYSVDWDMSDPTKSRQIYDHQFIAEREKESPIGRAWISYWDVSLIRYKDAEGHPHLLWVSDGKSTKSHLVTVDNLNLAGVCFWCLMGDDPAIWECVRDRFQR